MGKGVRGPQFHAIDVFRIHFHTPVYRALRGHASVDSASVDADDESVLRGSFEHF